MISWIAKSKRRILMILIGPLVVALVGNMRDFWVGASLGDDADFFRIFRCELWPNLLCYLNV